MPSKRVVLYFGPDSSGKPVVYRLVKDFELVVNIVQANVNPKKQGTMVLEISGERMEDGLDYLREQGVSVQSIVQEVVLDEEKCVMCGACTGVCPTAALYLERPSMHVRFAENQCILCELCVTICPVHAMEVRL